MMCSSSSFSMPRRRNSAASRTGSQEKTISTSQTGAQRVQRCSSESASGRTRARSRLPHGRMAVMRLAIHFFRRTREQVGGERPVGQDLIPDLRAENFIPRQFIESCIQYSIDLVREMAMSVRLNILNASVGSQHGGELLGIRLAHHLVDGLHDLLAIGF